MGYRLASQEPVDAGVRRIARKQLARAEDELARASRRFSRARIHTARKRIKKVRALLRLVRPALGKTYARENRTLRRIGHRLGALSDAAAVLDALDRLQKAPSRAFPPGVARDLRRALRRREAVSDIIASNNRNLQMSARQLHAARQWVHAWKFHAQDFAAVAGGLERTFRGARRAMLRAQKHPTAERLHGWRRRAKDQWFHLRLIEARCGRGLRRETAALEALDGVLGDCHDLALLKDAVTAQTSLRRVARAGVLRAIARDRRRLLQGADVLARRVYHEKPKAFVRRVDRLWSGS